MRFTEISLVLALSAVAAAAPHPDGEKTLYKAGTSPRYILARGPGGKTLHKGSAPQLLARDDEKVLHKAGASHLLARQSSSDTGSAGDSDYCYGVDATCASCFGTNWSECSDGVTCYDTTDPTSTCDSSSGSSDSGSSSGDSGETGSAGDSDYCYGQGVTCASCFGTNWTECPDDVTCYDVTDPTSTCDSSSGSDSGSSSGGSAGDSDYCYGADATCASCFGSGYIECSDGYTCYDPSDPTTSCPDGTSGTSSGSGTSTGGAGSGLIGTSTTSTAAGSEATTGDAGSVATTHASSSTTSHSSTSTTSSASSTSTATTGSSPVSGNTLGGSAAGISIPMGLSAGAGAAVLVAAALM